MSIQKIAYFWKNGDGNNKDILYVLKECLNRFMPGIIHISQSIKNAGINQYGGHQVSTPVSLAGFVQRSSSHRSETSFRPLRPIQTKESCFLDFWCCVTNLSRACLILSATLVPSSSAIFLRSFSNFSSANIVVRFITISSN